MSESRKNENLLGALRLSDERARIPAWQVSPGHPLPWRPVSERPPEREMLAVLFVTRMRRVEGAPVEAEAFKGIQPYRLEALFRRDGPLDPTWPPPAIDVQEMVAHPVAWCVVPSCVAWCSKCGDPQWDEERWSSVHFAMVCSRCRPLGAK